MSLCLISICGCVSMIDFAFASATTIGHHNILVVSQQHNKWYLEGCGITTHNMDQGLHNFVEMNLVYVMYLWSR